MSTLRQGQPRRRPAGFLLFLFFLLGNTTGCTYLFFNPGRVMFENPDVAERHPEDVFFKSSDGLTLHGWFFRAKEEKGTILVCHGNVENMSTHVTLDLWLIDAGYNLFIFDYRGYGTSEGAPDVQGIHLDAEAALETLLLRLLRTKEHKVIVFGKSLGGSVAVYTVTHSPYRDRVKALALDSPFSSYRMIAREKIAESIIGWPFQYPLSFLVNDDYSSVNFIAMVSPIPVMLIHGIHDTVVPVHHSRILLAAAREPKELHVLDLPGHVLGQADGAMRKRLLDLFAGAGPGEPVK